MNCMTNFCVVKEQSFVELSLLWVIECLWKGFVEAESLECMYTQKNGIHINNVAGGESCLSLAKHCQQKGT